MSFNVTIENEIALITFDDGKVNAVGFDLIAQFNDALDKAEREAKAVVMYGGESKFCGGFDLSVMKGDDKESQIKLVAQGAKLIKRLYGFAKPVVMAAEGHSIALGAVFLLAGDLRIGKQGEVKYGLNETAIGMVLPSFWMDLAKDRLAPTSVTEALLFSRLYQGQEAVTAGYLDMALPQDKVLPTAMAYAKQLTQLPAASFAESKRQLRQHTLAKMDV